MPAPLKARLMPCLSLLLGLVLVLISPFTAAVHADGTLLLAQAYENTRPRVRSMKIALVNPSSPRDGFRAIVDAIDPDGDEITLYYQWFHNSEEVTGGTEQILEWDNEFKKGDELLLEALPRDMYGEGVWRSQGKMMIPNSPPVITSLPKGIAEGGEFSYQVKATDPDGDEIIFSIAGAPKGMDIDPGTGKVVWKYADGGHEGSLDARIVVTDSEGARAEQVLRLNITPPEEAEAPERESDFGYTQEELTEAPEGELEEELEEGFEGEFQGGFEEGSGEDAEYEYYDSFY